VLLIVTGALAGPGEVLPMKRVDDGDRESFNKVVHHSLAQQRPPRELLPLERSKPGALPTMALADALDTIHVLVMKFEFQYEEVDDPNTTGRGLMNMTHIVDSVAYYDSLGHWVDPPPHNNDYYTSHMKALSAYYETVSQGRITLTWDIWPKTSDSAYQLPREMNYYGPCYSGLPSDVAFDTIVWGLEQYFLDCFEVADEASPDLEFSDYDSYFLFHAGSDQQNDLGFPTTCSDLYTGYIRYRDDDTLLVDNDSTQILDALIMPETGCQDNRATALNAVIAHEFGHQLGLVDLYTTSTFITSVGDFALMDHNGFGTAVDLGYDVGRVFGAFPVFPCAWSRAYLGFVEVYDFRQGTEIPIAAAEIVSEGIKVARIPISENEYYLLENRVVNPDGRATGLKADSNWVFLWPADSATAEPSGEYDFLLPGSGLAIYHVDEGVTVLDYDGDGVNNFDDNTLQNDPSRRFVSLMEADGVIDMSGYYEFGSRRFGCEEDLFREDRNSSFTPNTNPPAIDNSGNNTRVRVTDIQRQLEFVGGFPKRLDTLITFDLETERLVDGFPVRGGTPSLVYYGYSPIVDDLDRDGVPEIIFSYDDRVMVSDADGGNFLHRITECDPCIVFTDTAIASVHPGRSHEMPVYFSPGGTIVGNIVTGDFGDETSPRLLAVGTDDKVLVVQPTDDNGDGIADPVPSGLIRMTGDYPLGMSFGDRLVILTGAGKVVVKDTIDSAPRQLAQITTDEFFGMVRTDNAVIVVSGDEEQAGQTAYTRFHYLDITDRDYVVTDQSTVTAEIEGRFEYGPVMADFNRDGAYDIALMSADGEIVLVSVDLSTLPTLGTSPEYTVIADKATGYRFQTNPVAADINDDGYPELLIAGYNELYAFNHELTLITGFPVEVNDRFPDDDVIAAPIVADIADDGIPETMFPTLAGNINSMGPDMTYGFPVSSGETGLGSVVYWVDSSGGRIGYKGSDGWFYAWEVDADTTTDYWPMYGHDPEGTFRLSDSQLTTPAVFASGFDEDKFYSYPNPVTEGQTTIRYFLPSQATEVKLRIYDLSGQKVAEMNGPVNGGVDNEQVWVCGSQTPGVYRCVIDVDMAGSHETAFTDIAIIR